MNFVSGYEQPSDVASYNTRFDSDYQKNVPIRLFPFFRNYCPPRFVTWALTIWLPTHAALTLATAVVVMRFIANELAKHFTITILW